ncbi:glycosyl transferase family 4 [Candidatus Woesearchaeota archaeon]|nr:glycosyl transferase family 4 [Candidatus Woesearchaeota archaeon]
MAAIVPILSAFLGFLVTFLSLPRFIRYLCRIGLVVKDQNKLGTPLVPLSGGVVVIVGFIVAVMFFIFNSTFLPHITGFSFSGRDLTLLFAAITSILLVSLIGFIDDLLIRGDKSASYGLSQLQKPLLTLFAAIPLMVVNAGFTTINLPFIGDLRFGPFYPLVLVPVIVVVAANMVNMLAGFNGLEAGLGLVSIGMLGLYAFANDRFLAALIALSVFAPLAAFFYFNKYPAKILPGDSLTYLLGATLATLAILGNIERAVFIVSIPFFFEALLKARSKFKAASYGFFKDGRIHTHSDKVCSIPHFFTRTGRFTERQITYSIIFIEIVFSSLIWVI